MGRRIDYLDDPDAPAANSLVPSVNVAVVDERSRLLLIRRSDNDNWALPGGAMDLVRASLKLRSAKLGKRPASTARSRVWSASTRIRAT